MTIGGFDRNAITLDNHVMIEPNDDTIFPSGDLRADPTYNPNENKTWFEQYWFEFVQKLFNENALVIGVIVSSVVNNDGTDTEVMNYAIPEPLSEEFVSRCNCGVEIKRLHRERISFKDYSSSPQFCPSCGGYNTQQDDNSGILWCGDCDNEW